jgi:hypothetical protein
VCRAQLVLKIFCQRKFSQGFPQGAYARLLLG